MLETRFIQYGFYMYRLRKANNWSTQQKNTFDFLFENINTFKNNNNKNVYRD
jgi:hypothetical protein